MKSAVILAWVPAKPARLLVGSHYLQHAFDLSDREVVEQWVENPCWQLFCGEEYFQHELPIDPGLMTKWRKRKFISPARGSGK